jgi:hypothetical protein
MKKGTSVKNVLTVTESKDCDGFGFVLGVADDSIIAHPAALPFVRWEAILQEDPVRTTPPGAD